MPLGPTGEATILTALLAGRFVSLHTGDVGQTGANEVPATNAYARQSATFTQAGTNPTVASNNAAVQYPQATGSWGTITHFGIWDASSSGNFMGGGALTASKAIATGDIARWNAGTLQVNTD